MGTLEGFASTMAGRGLGERFGLEANIVSTIVRNMYSP